MWVVDCKPGRGWRERADADIGGHCDASAHLRGPFLKILRAPRVVGGELEDVELTVLTALVSAAGSVVFVETQELCEVHPAEPRAVRDLHQVLVVAVQRVPAE